MSDIKKEEQYSIQNQRDIRTSSIDMIKELEDALEAAYKTNPPKPFQPGDPIPTDLLYRDRFYKPKPIPQEQEEIPASSVDIIKELEDALEAAYETNPPKPFQPGDPIPTDLLYRDRFYKPKKAPLPYRAQLAQSYYKDDFDDSKESYNYGR